MLFTISKNENWCILQIQTNSGAFEATKERDLQQGLHRVHREGIGAEEETA